MTTVHNASLDAGAASDDITVSALEPHGVLAETEALIQSKTTTNGKYMNLARVPAGDTVVVYPTSATLRVKNIGPAAGVIEVTAK
jgi:hypothetical protein